MAKDFLITNAVHERLALRMFSRPRLAIAGELCAMSISCCIWSGQRCTASGRGRVQHVAGVFLVRDSRLAVRIDRAGVGVDDRKVSRSKLAKFGRAGVGLIKLDRLVDWNPIAARDQFGRLPAERDSALRLYRGRRHAGGLVAERPLFLRRANLLRPVVKNVARV